MEYRVDPIFHAGITDCLPGDHPNAWESLHCVAVERCGGVMVHAFNNETMRAWFETGQGPLCSDCMIIILDDYDGVLPDDFGLLREADVLPARGAIV